ncbi:alpha/beta fold hydrolase [Sciscionella marina]|uniref:alpha/beta fold hydrolase n=1 Tax=Sciscionella marina TaxID=508770 RepID=UPI0003640241|nr:alpha/beta fold hydrolase [Sciscionella marina]
MTRYVLVPGACHGGWWYDPITTGLRRAGHAADAVTLSGLDPSGPAAPSANLDTHIEEVTSILATHEEAVVLVGHSYGGAVITGAADRLPAQVHTLVYLDAFVPEDGDSCARMTNRQQRDWYLSGSAATGLGLAPLPFFDDRARPHPIGSLLQAVRLTGAHKTIARRHYVLAAAPSWLPLSPFGAVAEPLRADPNWTVTDLDAPHNLLANGGAELLELLLAHA